MSESVPPIPPGFTALTPHLTVADAKAAIDFYVRAFGATPLGAMQAPGEARVLHAMIDIGGAKLMLNDTFGEFGAKNPGDLGGSPVTIHLYVEDVDAVFARAVAAGATPRMPPADAFWGDRYGSLVDPFGHNWSIATCKRTLTPEQIEAGMREAFAKPPGG